MAERKPTKQTNGKKEFLDTAVCIIGSEGVQQACF